MKALRNLALALMVPVLASSLSAAEKPEIVDEYLPVGKMAEAAAVSVVLDESLQPFMEKIDGVFASLPDKDKKELVGQIVPGQPVPYDERLGWTKDEYAKYLECWKLKQVQEVAPVALGIFASGERNIWDLAAVAQQGPLPMSTLKYDSSTKSWISPNGTLTLKGDVSYDELNVYGAWSGKEWTMEKKTILSTLTETIIAGKTKDGKYMHIGVVTEGELSVEDEVTASVDAAYRQAICRAHTSTHLLQKALRKVLGDHVEQAGSYTANDHIRFDFTHFAALTPEELAKVEELVNDAILAGSPVITEEMSIDDAKKKGAMALFGEKYGQTVRVVQAGDSIELCGGTHLDNTAKAGSLKIIGEASVAAGVRRIEAVTGKAVLQMMNERQAVLNEAAAALKTNPNELVVKVEQQINDMRTLNKKLEKMGAKVAAMQMVDLFNVSRDVKGVEVVATKLDDATPEMLRTMGDDIKSKKENMVAVLSAVNGDKVSLLCVCGAEAIKKGAHAGKIIKEVAKIVGGGGGGRPDSATAGGKNPAKLEEALEAVNNIVDALL